MDWITDFIAATDHITSPALFRKWAGINAISGALERKVWFRTAGSVGYPNLYVVLVGPPGVGKTEIVYRVREQWAAVKTLHIASASVSKASLIDELNKATRHINRPQEVPAVNTYNSLLVASNELGVLLPAYDLSMMNTLQDLYDCKYYSETRRTRDISIEIKNPHITILAGCTPSYLSSVLPEGAWEQGFTARTIFIYSGDSIRVPLFEETKEPTEDWEGLKQRLKKISTLYGKVSFTKEAAELAQGWADSGGAPVPEHPRLFHYNTRRVLQMLKLSTIASCSRSESLIIEDFDVARAIDWLIEAESAMPDIFKAMTGSTHAQLIDDIYYFVFNAYNKSGKKPVDRSRLYNFVQNRTPAHNVDKVIEIMKKAGLVEDQLNGYVPRVRKD
jgi:hypothetical protein